MLLIQHHRWLFAAALALALAEYLWRRASGRGYDLGAAGASLGVALVQSLVRPLNLLATTAILVQVSRFAPYHWPLNNGWTWALAFFAVEFAYYWFHRWNHEIAWLWATHAVHHSATQMVLPAAIRLGWTEFVSLGWLAFVPLVLIGLPPQMIGALLALGLVYQYVLHTEAPVSLGPLEWLLNSPAHHRVHHSSDPQFLDCNYGGVLIVFDRLFGTFRAAAPGQELHYGLANHTDARTIWAIGLGAWTDLLRRIRKADSWTNRARIALGRPA